MSHIENTFAMIIVFAIFLDFRTGQDVRYHISQSAECGPKFCPFIQVGTVSICAESPLL